MDNHAPKMLRRRSAGRGLLSRAAQGGNGCSPSRLYLLHPVPVGMQTRYPGVVKNGRIGPGSIRQAGFADMGARPAILLTIPSLSYKMKRQSAQTAFCEAQLPLRADRR